MHVILVIVVIHLYVVKRSAFYPKVHVYAEKLASISRELTFYQTLVIDSSY